MLYDYHGTRTFTDTLQVNDPGNCAIKCEGTFKDGIVTLYGEYYMAVKTIMGRSYLIKFGPIVPDLAVMQNGYSCQFKTIKYNEAAIDREIKSFLNDSKYNISKAEEILDVELFELYPDLQTTWSNL